MKHTCSSLALFGILLLNFSLFANRLVFYRAPYFFGEPRLTRDYLGSLEATLGGGKTDTGFDHRGRESNILNIYGPENFRNMAQNVPQGILDLYPGSVLDNLWNESLPGFGLIDFFGYFKLTEMNFNYQQNILHGFFVEANLPLRKLTIADFQYRDLSTQALAGTASWADWQSFVSNLVTNMQKYGIYITNYHQFAPGDAYLGLGWSQSNVDHHTLDFWDTSIRIGIMPPFAPSVCPSYPLMVPSGYNKHIGFPISFDFSMGFFEWLTLGLYIEGILFTKKYQILSMKTASAQNGLVNLTQGAAHVDKGNIWQFGTFIKSDHMPWGLSVVLAYSYSAEQRTFVYPSNLTIFDYQTVNSNRTLLGWHMHTINLNFEYDFAVEESKRHFPRLRLNFDIPFGGNQVFKNTFFSGTFGFDFVW